MIDPIAHAHPVVKQQPTEKQCYLLELMIKGHWVPASQPYNLSNGTKNPYYQCRCSTWAHNRATAKVQLGLIAVPLPEGQQWRLSTANGRYEG